MEKSCNVSVSFKLKISMFSFLDKVLFTSFLNHVLLPKLDSSSFLVTKSINLFLFFRVPFT